MQIQNQLQRHFNELCHQDPIFYQISNLNASIIFYSEYSIIGIYSHSDTASVRFTGQTKPHVGWNRQSETALPESFRHLVKIGLWRWWINWYTP